MSKTDFLRALKSERGGREAGRQGGKAGRFQKGADPRKKKKGMEETACFCGFPHPPPQDRSPSLPLKITDIPVETHSL